MKPDTHVYCTRCRHFKFEDDEILCPHQNECHFWDTEDSRPFRERPKYEDRIRQAMKEVDLMKSGEMPKKTWKKFKEELKLMK